MINRNKIGEIIRKGWIIHETKRMELGSNFVTLHDRIANLYCDPMLGWIKDDLNSRNVLPYDHRRKKNRLGMKMILSFDQNEGAIYIFSLYACLKKPYWEMDAVSALCDIGGMIKPYSAMMSSGQLKWCAPNEIGAKVFKGDRPRLSSILANEDKIYPQRYDNGRLFMSAIGAGKIAYGDKKLTNEGAVEKILNHLDGAILTRGQAEKILRLFSMIHEDVGKGKMLTFLSKNSCAIAMEELLEGGKCNGSHYWEDHFELQKIIFDNLDPAVRMYLPLDAINGILRLHAHMKTMISREAQTIISYLNKSKGDILKESGSQQVVKDIGIMVKMAERENRINGWEELR